MKKLDIPSGWTPGPWSIVEYGDGDSLVVHSTTENRVCFMATAGSYGDPAKIEADARLIALAPQLATAYEALWEERERLRDVLDRLVAEADDHDPGESFPRVTRDGIEIARAALGGE